jgi:tight adherence protein C
MDGAYDVLIGVFGDRSAMMLALMVFLAVAVLTFSLMAAGHARSSVRRRAAGIAEYSGEREAADPRSLRQSSLRAVQRLLDHTTKHYSTADNGDTKILRKRLIQAGIFDPRAVASFFVARTALAAGLGLGAYLLLPMLIVQSSSMHWLSAMVCGIIGYIGPSFYLDRRISRNKDEHRSGFPDFMDLMVVCADSGLSMEAALERVGRELGDGYPSLCANIHMTCLEIRAGRTMTEALEHLGDRLGLEEARSFATLIQQSAELGSSITEALRVYSDDMRHKRLSRAEEKAYSLPAKLSLPMMICIFPTIFVVILLPVVVRLYTGNY